MVEEKPKEKKKEEVWIVDEVPTQTTLVVRNTKTNEILDLTGAIAKILNDLEELKKLL